MPITYTNRKGRIYYLCVGTTNKGKPRYNFSTEPKETPVDEIPEGYEIQESVNGVVSLIRTKPCLIPPEDSATVEAILKSHPEASRYRLSVKSKTITIHELAGPGRDEIRKMADYLGVGWRPGIIAELESITDRQFRPILQFTLTNETKRLYTVERWCFRGSIDGWTYVHAGKRLKPLAAKTIPLLGTDDFYEL